MLILALPHYGIEMDPNFVKVRTAQLQAYFDAATRSKAVAGSTLLVAFVDPRISVKVFFKITVYAVSLR